MKKQNKSSQQIFHKTLHKIIHKLQHVPSIISLSTAAFSHRMLASRMSGKGQLHSKMSKHLLDIVSFQIIIPSGVVIKMCNKWEDKLIARHLFALNIQKLLYKNKFETALKVVKWLHTSDWSCKREYLYALWTHPSLVLQKKNLWTQDVT
jgi:hypothetical protein